MLRLATVILLAAYSTAALAQVGVPPPVPSPSTPMVAPLAPSAPLPIPPPNVGAPANIVHVPGFRPVQVPSVSPGRNSFSDRVANCVHAGTAAGIRSNRIGSFTAQCAQ